MKGHAAGRERVVWTGRSGWCMTKDHKHCADMTCRCDCHSDKP